MSEPVVFYGPAHPPHHTFAPFYTQPANWMAATLAVNVAADDDLYLYAYARRNGWPVYRPNLAWELDAAARWLEDASTAGKLTVV